MTLTIFIAAEWLICLSLTACMTMAKSTMVCCRPSQEWENFSLEEPKLWEVFSKEVKQWLKLAQLSARLAKLALLPAKLAKQRVGSASLRSRLQAWVPKSHPMSAQGWPRLPRPLIKQVPTSAPSSREQLAWATVACLVWLARLLLVPSVCQPRVWQA